MSTKFEEFAHHVFQSASVDEFSALQKESKPDYNLPNNKGWTILMSACAYERDDLVGLIIDKTENIGACTVLNRTHVLHLACISKNPKLLQELASCPERREKLARLVNQPNAHGDTPLMMACVAKNLDACVILWSLGADCSLKNKNGMTALMCAARVQDSNDQHSAVSVSIVKGLLERLEAEDIHCVDVLKRNTALHIAVQSGNKGGVKELVKAPGKSLHVYNMDGYTAYALAQHIKASEEVIQILCEHSEMKLAPLDLSEAECVLQSKKKDGKRKSKTKRKQLKNRKDNAQIQKDDPFPYVNHSESVLAAVEKCNQEPRMPVECQEAIGLIDSGFTDVKDGSDYIYDQLNAFFHYLNPLAQEIAVNVDAFVVSCPRPILPEPDLDRNIEEILSSLSISQIETLENAHLSAYNALNERKQLKMRVLEAQRVEEKLALQKILTIQN